MVVMDVKQELRCCFCWQGPVEGKGAHIAGACGWLLSWNKKRADPKVNLSPITVLEGSISIPTARIPLTVEKLGGEVIKVRKELTGQIKALDTRVSMLEGPKKKKGKKGGSQPASTGGASAPTASTSTTTSGQPARAGNGTSGRTGRAQQTSNAGRGTTHGRGTRTSRRGNSGRGGA
jgi:hypothetical protein